jgi:hypothetical protein
MDTSRIGVWSFIGKCSGYEYIENAVQGQKETFFQERYGVNIFRYKANDGLIFKSA